MSRPAVTWLRVAIVAVYAFIGGGLATGGITAGEFVLLVVLGVIAFIAVVVADWVNDGIRHDDERG